MRTVQEVKYFPLYYYVQRERYYRVGVCVWVGLRSDCTVLGLLLQLLSLLLFFSFLFLYLRRVRETHLQSGLFLFRKFRKTSLIQLSEQQDRFWLLLSLTKHTSNSPSLYFLPPPSFFHFFFFLNFIVIFLQFHRFYFASNVQILLLFVGLSCSSYNLFLPKRADHNP